MVKVAKIIGCRLYFMGLGPSYFIELTEIFHTSLPLHGLKIQMATDSTKKRIIEYH